MKIKFKKVHEDVELPELKTAGASGVDVRAFLLNENPPWVEILKGERKLVKTGLRVEIPKGYELQVRPRSGMSLKQGITVLNSPGTIDSDYRGEIGVILINHGQGHVIHNGDRIAQLVLQKVEDIEWEEVVTLDETERNQGGFGSTGDK